MAEAYLKDKKRVIPCAAYLVSQTKSPSLHQSLALESGRMDGLVSGPSFPALTLLCLLGYVPPPLALEQLLTSFRFAHRIQAVARRVRVM